MSEQHNQASFRTTHWSLVFRAGAANPEIRRQALGEILTRYQPAMLAYLRRSCRLQPEEAEEILQGFFTSKLVERQLLTTADPEKGRLRALMIRSLKNYLNDVRSKKKPLELADESWAAPVQQLSAHDTFDVAWARTVLLESLRRMHEACCLRKRTQIWQLFEMRAARPILTGAAPLEYAELVSRFKFKSPEQASNSLMTAMRQFRKVLREVVAEYAIDDEVEWELTELRNILAAAGPVASELNWTDSLESGVLQRIGLLSGGAPSAVESNAWNWSSLFSLESERDALWQPEELKSLLADQLRLPLSEVLLEFGEDKALAWTRTSEKAIATLSDLFSDPKPPLELLMAVKRGARRAVRNDGCLPVELATQLYFASIATALVRHNERISKSDDATLRFGFERVLNPPCADVSFTALLRAARDKLSAT